MTSTKAAGDLTLGRCAPTIPVSDIERALMFYRDVLGLEVAFTNGSPVGFVIMKRDLAELHLTLVRGYKANTWNVAHLIVSDARMLHQRCESHGARIVKGLRDHDYGVRAFVVADPDGNRIDVGERLA